MQQIRADEISDIIRNRIEDFDKEVQVAETGTVLNVGDGVARIYGLQGAMAGEMVEFPGGLFGVVLNLDEESVGVAVFGEVSPVRDAWRAGPASRRANSSWRQPTRPTSLSLNT